MPLMAATIIINRIRCSIKKEKPKFQDTRHSVHLTLLKTSMQFAAYITTQLTMRRVQMHVAYSTQDSFQQHQTYK